MKVQIFCVRISHYFGLGVTPDAAIAALPSECERGFLRAVEHVARPPGKDANGKVHYTMHRLPDGVSEVWVDDFGALCWRFPDGTPEAVIEAANATRVYFDPAQGSRGKWIETPVEEDTRDEADRLDALFEPFTDACTGALDALADCKVFDVEKDPVVLERLSEFAEDVRQRLRDVIGRR